MVDVSRTLTVRPPLATVVEYLTDFARAEEWDPGTVTCVKITDGPVALGTSWRNTSVFRGKETTLVYRLERIAPDELVFVGRNKTATSVDTVSFAALPDGGTSITYRSEVQFHGLARLVDPFMKKEFDRLGDELIPKMTTAVNRLV